MADIYEKVRCNKCQRLILRDEQLIHGCGCDPDAPTWIAIRPDGRLIAMSHANYEIVK